MDVLGRAAYEQSPRNATSDAAVHPARKVLRLPLPPPPPPTRHDDAMIVPPYLPVRGVGVNVVNVFWERLSAALGEDGDAPSSPATKPAKLLAASQLRPREAPPVFNGTSSLEPQPPNASSAPRMDWDWRHMGGSERRHSFRDLRARGIDLVGRVGWLLTDFFAF
jgi:hypothetical protein